MSLSIVVARVLAITYLSAAIAALTGKINFGRIVEDFERSYGLTFVSGFIALVLGTLLVNYHNIWTMHWQVLITLVGYLSLLKGILLIAFPQTLSSFKPWYKNTRRWGILMLVLGVIFAFFGFVY